MTVRLQLWREPALVLPTHVSGSFLVAEHVGVRSHDRRPWLFGDAGGLRGGFALVHQLLHCVCDAFVTQQSGTHQGRVKNAASIELKSMEMGQMHGCYRSWKACWPALSSSGSPFL